LRDFRGIGLGGLEPLHNILSTLQRCFKHLLINLYRQSEQKVSKDYNHEIGYETLQRDWDVYKKQTPRGVTLAKGGSNIYLQFKTPSTPRSKYKCDCTFSIDGMIDAVRKAHRVADKLKSLTSEVEFWSWYDKEIKQESQLADDRMTFGDAIAKVENDFWGKLSRTRRKRDKSNPSDINSWDKTYGTFYRHLPKERIVSLAEIQKGLTNYTKGSRTYKYYISAVKKLCRVSKQKVVLEALEDVDTTQTIFTELQTTNLEEFMKWRDETLGITRGLHQNAELDVRRAWLWVFSTQIVYALRISEVFAIKNLTEPYKTKDGVSIPALNDPENTDNLIYIGEKTNLGTTVKTGARIARPQIPPKYPDLIERLDIKNPFLPDNKPAGDNPRSLRNFHCATARRKLV
jgi:hypothetical protein